MCRCKPVIGISYLHTTDVHGKQAEIPFDVIKLNLAFEYRDIEIQLVLVNTKPLHSYARMLIQNHAPSIYIKPNRVLDATGSGRLSCRTLILQSKPCPPIHRKHLLNTC